MTLKSPVQIALKGNQGTVLVDGHSIANVVCGLDFSVRPGRDAKVTVELAIPDLDFEGDAVVRVGERTAAALVVLGWTPPGQVDTDETPAVEVPDHA